MDQSIPVISNKLLFFIIIIFGGFGGVLGSLSRLDTTYANILKHKLSWDSALSFAFYIFIKILFGIGGGFSVILILSWIGKFDPSKTISNIFFLKGLCVVAGFSGEKLITILARKLERDVENNKKAIEETKKELEEENSYIQVINKANDLMKFGTKSERKSSINEVLNLKPKCPLDRKLNLFLGRLYRSIGDYDAAIKALSDFIFEKEKAGEGNDIDTADALYNRACYNNLNYISKLPDLSDSEKEQIEDLIYNDLKKAFKYNPENIEDAKEDEDFSRITAEQRFIELTRNS